MVVPHGHDIPGSLGEAIRGEVINEVEDVELSASEDYFKVRTSNSVEGNIRDIRGILRKKYANMADWLQLVVKGLNDKTRAFLKDVENATSGVLRPNKMARSSKASKEKRDAKIGESQMFAMAVTEASSMFQSMYPPVPHGKPLTYQVANHVEARFTTTDSHNKSPLTASNEVLFTFIAECCQQLVVPSNYPTVTALCQDLVKVTELQWFSNVSRMNHILRRDQNVVIPDAEKTALLAFLSEKTKKIFQTGTVHGIVVQPVTATAACTTPPWWTRFCEGITSWTNRICHDYSDSELERFMKLLQEKSNGKEWLTVDNWRQLLNFTYVEIPPETREFLIGEMRPGGFLVSSDDHLLCTQLRAFVQRCKTSEGLEVDDVFGKLRNLCGSGGSFTKQLFEDMLSTSLLNEIPVELKLWLRTAIFHVTEDPSVILSSPILPARRKATLMPSTVLAANDHNCSASPVSPSLNVVNKRLTKKRGISPEALSSPSMRAKKKQRKDEGKAAEGGKGGSGSVHSPDDHSRMTHLTKSGRRASKFSALGSK